MLKVDLNKSNFCLVTQSLKHQEIRVAVSQLANLRERKKSDSNIFTASEFKWFYSTHERGWEITRMGFTQKKIAQEATHSVSSCTNQTTFLLPSTYLAGEQKFVQLFFHLPLLHYHTGSFPVFLQQVTTPEPQSLQAIGFTLKPHHSVFNQPLRSLLLNCKVPWR